MGCKKLRRTDRTFIHYENILRELAMSMYEWKNIPDTCDVSYLERSLLETGWALFFTDEVLGYLALRATIAGRFNVYEIPTERRAYASNGYNVIRDNSDSVLIYNNYLKTSSLPDIYYFAEKLANIDKTIDVNINAQKTPLVILCDEKQKLTMKSMYTQYEGFEPVIFGDKYLNVSDVKVLKTDAPFIAQHLYDLKQSVWQEAMTCLGIPNSSVEKRERVNAAEVQANAAGTIAFRYPKLEMRKKACAEINKMFGLNMDVEFRDDLTAQLDAINDDIMKVHTTTEEDEKRWVNIRQH